MQIGTNGTNEKVIIEIGIQLMSVVKFLQTVHYMHLPAPIAHEDDVIMVVGCDINAVDDG